MRVLVTGGCGFLGRGILRRNRRDNLGWEITVLNRDEAKQIKVRAQYPEAHFVKADVSSPPDYLANIFLGHDVVIHAGANKLVDVGERSVLELIKNNVEGSRNVALAAVIAGVRQVIGISSDKAVQPVNTYGMTKSLMERIFQEADTLSQTQFVCARYGNVVGSTISIVLYFQEQLGRLGHILVTNPEMTRFYMGVDEAIDAILYSMDKADRGSVVIPKMQSMSVADVARLVLNVPEEFPLQPSVDSGVMKVIGARPGEKLHESLLHTQESVRVIENQVHQSYYELRPSIEGAQRNCEFEITSDKPPLGKMKRQLMLDLIKDAATI